NSEEIIKERSTNEIMNEGPSDNEEIVLKSSNDVVKTTKELEWQEYVNELVSIPSEIKILPGICLEPDLNPVHQQSNSDSVSMRKETQQQFEITSPNTVTVRIPENQLQNEQDHDNEEKFSPVIRSKNQNKKKEKKKKQNDNAPPHGGRSN
ncbi:hypothetical protein A4A49_61662, partial [Nicotiana attenuata]